MADTEGNAPVVPAGAGDAGGAAQPQMGAWEVVKSILSRLLMFYCISTIIKGFMGGQNVPNNGTSSSPAGKGYGPARNMYPPGQFIDFYVFLSDSEEKFVQFEEADMLFWKESSIRYGDWAAGPAKDGSLVRSRSLPTPPSLLHNGSLFVHFFAVKSGHSLNPKDRTHVKREVIYGVKQLNKYKKKFYKKTANLLTGKSDQSEEDLKKAEEGTKFEVLNFWHPNLTINLVDDHTAWTKGSLPAPLDEAVQFDPSGTEYKPILFFNNYWNLGSEYQPVNDSVKEINLTLTFAPLSLFKYQLYASQQMRSKWSAMMGGDLLGEENDDENDTIKQALIETNPVLLAVTVAVSLLHTVFEFLAFKNDIQFWRSRKSLEGLSVRSVLFSVFQSLIVLLYICDNDTNFVVKISVFVGLLIELWKIPKVMDVKVNWEEKIAGVFPKIELSDKGSYVESDTKQYDQLAFKYLSWVLYPLLAGYAVYSLMYVEQKGWYSWVLSMLYGFLLTFGFIMMTPQLFINYKLKSVAHLPWRMLTYKFINTFIDDLFAFVIRMPTMYRLGCFRDDIVFLVYIYQRWIYRVDPKRVNEYGTSMEDPTGAVAVTEEEKEKAVEEKKKNGDKEQAKETKKEK